MPEHVVVVGAGPTGLTAALELARRGTVPTVIEQRPTPSQLSRAVGILPSSMDLLAPSGVAAKLEAEAVRFSGLIFHHGNHELARLSLNFDHDSRIWGLAQDRTEAHLRQALARHGGEVRYGVAFDALAQEGDKVTVATSEGEITCDRVVAADGAHSAVRQALGVDYAGFDLPERWSIADVRAEGWSDPTCFKGFMLPAGNVCVVVPLEPGRFRVIASQPEALDALPVPMTVTETKNTGEFTIPVRQARRYTVGRVHLAGDAAHSHSPVGGRGMNLGIADAADLARRITAGRTGGYHDARHPEGTHVLKLSERGRRTMQATNPARRAAVIATLFAAGRVPPLGRALMRQLVSG